jgi:hypothetical protein
MTANVFNKFVNQAGSFNHGMRLLQHAKNSQGRNYKINKNGQNYKNYTKKLAAKFPTPVSKKMLTYFWQNSNSNSEFLKRLRLFAERSGQTVNENQLRGILATRAKTRAGVKRKRNAENERMYLVNNAAWYNSVGTNVTNRINKNNWTLTNNNNKSQLIRSYANGTSVKTYKRKVV